MITRQFNPLLPLLYVIYARMSSKEQNPRSPEQQIDVCKTEMDRRGYPWQRVRDDIDRAVSGRLIRKRLEFNNMMNDIRSGRLKTDLILVDTFERLGRAPELEAIRRELDQRYGVLVVTADTGFSDPTSVAGKIHATFESLRATEDNRVKGHNVLRGKRDAVQLKHWPGGPPPFGYRIENVLVEKNGRQVVDHGVLVRDRQKDWIIAHAYQMAADRSWGSTRVTKALNHDPSIPEDFKPFIGATVGRWLSNPVYYGEYYFGKHSTDIVEDRRVIERNDPDLVMRVPEFCEPIVLRELWNRVQIMRQVRRQRSLAARETNEGESDKKIQAIAPGLALKYPLSGLVRCGNCKRAMIASSSGEYVTKAGIARRYVSYQCQATNTGLCSNRCKIPEPWLRETVTELLIRRLFGVE